MSQPTEQPDPDPVREPTDPAGESTDPVETSTGSTGDCLERAGTTRAAGCPPWAWILGIWAVLAVVVTMVAITAIAHRSPTNTNIESRPWIDAWLVDDARWYQAIAADGYSYTPGQQSSVAFFPAYPMAVRGVGLLLGGDVRLAAWLVALAAGLAAVLLFTGWVWSRLPRPAALTAVAVLMLYPYSFFLYGPMMSDAFFLLLALAPFVLLERRMFWAAGFVGALATAARPVGVAVAVGLVVRTLEVLAERRATAPPGRGPARRWPAHVGWRELYRAVPAVRWREAGVLLSGVGLAAWCVYLLVNFGDPLAFNTVQAAPGWYQGTGPKTWFKAVFLGTMVKGPFDVALRLFAQALMCLIAVLLLRRVWRLFGWGYLAFSVVVLLIPLLGTKDFMGTGRYVMAAFPVIAAAGHVLANARPGWLRPVVLAAGFLGMLVVTWVFATGTSVT